MVAEFHLIIRRTSLSERWGSGHGTSTAVGWVRPAAGPGFREAAGTSLSLSTKAAGAGIPRRSDRWPALSSELARVCAGGSGLHYHRHSWRLEARILDAVAAGRDELVELTTRLIGFDTTARTPDDPPRQEADLQAYLGER